MFSRKKQGKVRLHAPDKQFGFYLLSDGSRIYPSGSPNRPIQPGKWFLWRCLSSYLDDKGRIVKSGEILLTTAGIRYFDSPQEAVEYLLNGDD